MLRTPMRSKPPFGGISAEWIGGIFWVDDLEDLRLAVFLGMLPDRNTSHCRALGFGVSNCRYFDCISFGRILEVCPGHIC